jgi:hypothetical protein
VGAILVTAETCNHDDAAVGKNERNSKKKKEKMSKHVREKIV